MSRKNLYLVLAILGAVIPYYFLVQHFASAGLSIVVFLQAAFGNLVASGFTADLIISSVVFWVAMFHRQSRGKGPQPWLFILINLTIGLSCALPAYLYAGERSDGAN